MSQHKLKAANRQSSAAKLQKKDEARVDFLEEAANRHHSEARHQGSFTSIDSKELEQLERERDISRSVSEDGKHPESTDSTSAASCQDDASVSSLREPERRPVIVEQYPGKEYLNKGDLAENIPVTDSVSSNDLEDTSSSEDSQSAGKTPDQSKSSLLQTPSETSQNCLMVHRLDGSSQNSFSKGLEASLKDPKASLKDPKDSKGSLKDPKASLEDQKASLKEPKVSVKDVSFDEQDSAIDIPNRKERKCRQETGVVDLNEAEGPLKQASASSAGSEAACLANESAMTKILIGPDLHGDEQREEKQKLRQKLLSRLRLASLYFRTKRKN